MTYNGSPPNQPTHEITELLQKCRAGDRAAEGQLFSKVHDELRKLAGAKMRSERPGRMLQPTALVNEVYLRLVGTEGLSFENRRHFYGAASLAMQRILSNAWRDENAGKRPPPNRRRPLEDDVPAAASDDVDPVELSAALDKLVEQAPALAEIVRLRYFGGLEHKEIAECLAMNAAEEKSRYRAAINLLRGFMEAT